MCIISEICGNLRQAPPKMCPNGRVETVGADKLYRNGDNIVRMLIENSFIYSIISVMSLDPAERHWVKSIIPASLYSIYLKQVTASGC
jgi:hypothetical protein